MVHNNKDIKINISELVGFVIKNVPGAGITKINKLAFLLEWSYIFDTGEYLTDSDFAILPMGPVINNYKEIVKKMGKEKMIAKNTANNADKEAYLFTGDNLKIDSKIENFLLKVLKKYKELSTSDLIQYTHSLESFAIAKHNYQKNKTNYQGKIIDKNLAYLDSNLIINEGE